MRYTSRRDLNMSEKQKTKKKLKLKQPAPKTKKEKKMGRKKLLNSLAIAFLSLIFIGCVSVFALLIFIMRDAPNLHSDMFNASSSSILVNVEDEAYGSLGAEDRENITFDQIPQSVVDAFLSIEDSRFYTHNGFDLPRFISSAKNNLLNGNLGQGGSTLTMQMIDNVRKDDPTYDEANASSLQRIEWKIQEIILSMQVEGDMDKNEILTKYLNKVNFGYTARGIQKGAKYYFGKDVSQLNLSESAFLAGVVNAPNLFNPYNGTKWNKNTEKWVDYYQYAIDRRDDTLYQMFNHGYIDQEEYDLAKSTELAFQLDGTVNMSGDAYESYVNVVVKEAIDKYGINPNTTSVKIYTTMDPDAQKMADQIINDELINGIPDDDNYQFGFSLMNNQTGEIAAIGAARQFNPDDVTEVNQALEPHQTGSTIKPILDYAPGFDQLGYSTSHIFNDIPLDINGQGKALTNSDGKYRGSVTFEDTVGNSYNTTAAQSLIDLRDKWGTDNIVGYMNSIGFTKINKNDFAIQYGIGGADMVSSPVSMAGAYAIFANEGKYIEPHTITKIEFLDEDKEPIIADYEEVQTISSQAAYLMSDILHKATGINVFMNKLGMISTPYTMYGKTGTSDWGDSGADYGIPEGAIRDEWMVNYTGNYVVATWSGYEKPDYMRNSVLYANIPGQINKSLLDLMASKQSPSPVANPGGISTISHIKGTFPYAAPTKDIPSDMVTSGMVKSEFNKTVALTADPLKSLSSFSASYADGNVVKLNFAAYPDADKTSEPSKSKTYNVLGISFTGNVAFDPGFVFGRVVYKADVKLDGNVIQTFTVNEPVIDQTLNGDYAGKTLQVCGFYAYEFEGSKSNESCTNITVPEAKKPVVTSELQATLLMANAYLDPTKYRADAITNLNNEIAKANATLGKTDVKQEEIDASKATLQAAIDNCKNNPLDPTAPKP